MYFFKSNFHNRIHFSSSNSISWFIFTVQEPYARSEPEGSGGGAAGCYDDEDCYQDEEDHYYYNYYEGSGSGDGTKEETEEKQHRQPNVPNQHRPQETREEGKFQCCQLPKLGSGYCIIQCENFKIFLAFSFYVKSTLENQDILRLPLFAIAILGALNFVHLATFQS